MDVDLNMAEVDTAQDLAETTESPEMDLDQDLARSTEPPTRNAVMEAGLHVEGIVGHQSPALLQAQADDASALDGQNVLESNISPDEYIDGLNNELNLEDFIGEGQTKYDLRPQARELKSTFSRTWVDDDKTGLYDPAEEQRKLRQRPKRKIRPVSTFTPWNLDDSDEEDEQRKERPAKEKPKLVVKLGFKSEAGREAFVNHVLSLPAEPDPSEELFCERRLRRRDSGVGLSHTFPPKTLRKRELPEDLPEDLTGHPIARGCWECLAIGIRCPLLDDNRAWPCTTCTDDQNQCELITPPNYKRPCEHCRSKRTGCSYTYSLDHEGPCEECARIGGYCIAGPAQSAIRERISYDRDWDNDPWQTAKPPKIKKLPSCQGCRERGQPCSFASGDTGDKCTACDMAERVCVPELQKPQRRRKRKRQDSPKTKAKADEERIEKDDGDKIASDGGLFDKPAQKRNPIVIDEEDEDGSSPEDAPNPPKRSKIKPIIIESSEDDSSEVPDMIQLQRQRWPQRKPKLNSRVTSSSNRSSDMGTLATIITKFSHPIAFNHQPTESQPCHFCPDARFGMFGLGPADVEVLIWNDGRGLEEISAGHRSKGVEQTRMCVSCTTKRLPIMMCGKHELRKLSDAATTSTPKARNSALTSLLNGTTTGRERWCSLCATLAQYTCRAAGPHGKGCGLLLCEACMVSVTASEGDLDLALEGLKDEVGPDRIWGCGRIVGF